MTSPSAGLLKILPLIRIAMITSVVSAGAVIWYLTSESADPAIFDTDGLGADDSGDSDSNVTQLPNFNLYFLGLISVVAMVVMFVRRKLQEDLDMQRRCAFVLIAWSSAEGIGLLGAALTFFGDATFFIAGLMIMLMTFAVVQIPSDENDSIR